ncbi:MAG: dodecin family protein [Armatimonadota bacterium]
MAVARIVEVKAGSTESLEAAIQEGIDYATENYGDVQSAWVNQQEAVVEGGRVSEYRVDMKVTYMART